MRRTERSLFSVASACGMWVRVAEMRRESQAGAVWDVVVSLEVILVLKGVRTTWTGAVQQNFL